MAQQTPTLLNMSPLGEMDGRPMTGPPAIIPIAQLPQNILASLPMMAAQNAMMAAGQPLSLQTLQTRSHPSSLMRREHLIPQTTSQYRSLTTVSLPRQAMANTYLPVSSPEDDLDDDVGCSEEEAELEQQTLKGDPRHNRRREMNRIAQQKSRLKKDQKITDLQAENDQLKAKIISLDAEVKVWKNMTKKSENEANDLRRRLEEKEEQIQEHKRTIRNLKSRHYDELDELDELAAISTTKKQSLEEEDTMDGLQIDEAIEEKLALDRPEKTEPQTEIVIESSSTPETTKEIQSLTTELQRMYTLTNQQAETNKLLHQALDDQQKRFKRHGKNDEEDAQLEFSSIQQVVVDPVKKASKAKNRWIRRNVSRGISKRGRGHVGASSAERDSQYKAISRYIKNGSFR